MTLSGSRSTPAAAGASRRGSGGAVSPGQAAIAPRATEPAKGGGRGGRRAAPSGQRQDRHGGGGEDGPLRIDSGRRRAPGRRAPPGPPSAAAAIQSGVAAWSGVARCGSSAMKAAASASCRPTCTNRADAQWPRRSGDLRSARNPRRTRRRPRPGEPQPAAQPGQRIGRPRDGGEIDHERPRVGCCEETSSGTMSEPARPRPASAGPCSAAASIVATPMSAEQDEGCGRADEP